MYPSQNKRRKRTMTEVNQDDGSDFVSRTDDGHPDVYSRSFSNSHARTEVFRSPSKSSINMNSNDVPPQHYGPPSHERSWGPGPDPYLRGWSCPVHTRDQIGDGTSVAKVHPFRLSPGAEVMTTHLGGNLLVDDVTIRQRIITATKGHKVKDDTKTDETINTANSVS
ncbi:hypothetical protein CONPUDRAFT_158169 [Coniophora puteana RWD-64-598 SS2]|uniref:Uncharacterized protein n=1 Tax=Coniophora puteana (strain RWD-64-598) TaxID=741705 RepID=A0A5M3MBX5_CONPW|nr:uncharacterized protein CONPUDRAFT_158169 [Coniophora puteana RWD-64-598 SS2]EIW76135.1 hypothetical protein CONPUDRAFT_158169 [Coniophora puteana RWD-64-598 SS2]